MLFWDALVPKKLTTLKCNAKDTKQLAGIRIDGQNKVPGRDLKTTIAKQWCHPDVPLSPHFKVDNDFGSVLGGI